MPVSRPTEDAAFRNIAKRERVARVTPRVTDAQILHLDRVFCGNVYEVARVSGYALGYVEWRLKMLTWLAEVQEGL